MAVMAIFSFLFMPLVSMNGTAAPADYSIMANEDFTMGNTYNDNVSFTSVVFAPNNSFNSVERSTGSGNHLKSVSRQFRINNTWFNYRYRNGNIHFYETQEFFAFVDDGDEHLRETTITPEFGIFGQWENSITFYSNGTYYLYIHNRNDNTTKVFYGTDPTNLSTTQVVYEHETNDDYFTEIYKWNDTTYYTFISELDTISGYWNNLSLVISTDLMNWTKTNSTLFINSDMDLMDCSSYIWNNSYYIAVWLYNDSLGMNGYHYYSTDNIFAMNNYTLTFNETTDDKWNVKFYPIGHTLVKYYFNSNTNKLHADIFREKYEVYENGIYKFYYNGVYEKNTEVANGTLITDYICWWGRTGTWYSADVYQNWYGFNMFALGSLAYVDFVSFNLEHPELLVINTYMPPEVVNYNIGTRLLLNSTLSSIIFTDTFYVETIGNNYVNYWEKNSAGVDDESIKYAGFSNIYFEHQPLENPLKKNMKITIMNNPSEMDDPFWFTAQQLLTEPTMIMGWILFASGLLMIVIRPLPTKLGAVAFVAGASVLAGTGIGALLSTLF